MTELKKAKGIIFDLDGTLIDSIADIAKISNKTLSEYGFPTHSLDKYIDWVGNGARKLIEKAVPQNMTSAAFETFFQDYLNAYEYEEHTESSLYESIPELLTLLNKEEIPIAILTNKPHPVTLKTLERYFAPWHFVRIEGQQEGHPRKPDPTMAIDIAKTMNLLPEEVIFIGDSAVDINTGKAAGMITLCINDGYETLDNILRAQPDIMVDDHKELMGIIKTLR